MQKTKFNNLFKAFMKQLNIYFICLILVIAIRVLILYIHYKLNNPYYGYSYSYILDPNSFVSLDNNVEWRLIGNSDLTKITPAILDNGWKECLVDTKNWNIFNPYAHEFWSDDHTPLSKFFIENRQTGIVESLQKVWPIANSSLEGLGLINT